MRFIIFISLFLTNLCFAETTKQALFSSFSDLDACFLQIDNKSGKVVSELNHSRCTQQFAPCSTFKMPLALMSFEEKVFPETATKITWDKKIREREELNKDQTPVSWIKDSVLWVSQIVTKQVGDKKLKSYLKTFSYGNQDTSEGIDQFWLSASLKISAEEQVKFLRKMWNEKLPLSKLTYAKTKEIIFTRELSTGEKIYGKTGTCCIDNDCTKNPKQLGWFVGVVEKGNHSESFAFNFSDKDASKSYAGPRARKMVMQILENEFKSRAKVQSNQ